MSEHFSTNPQDYYLDGLHIITKEIAMLANSGDCLYRGEPEEYAGDPFFGKVSSTLYRMNPDLFDSSEVPIEQIQQFFVSDIKNIIHAYTQTDDFEILTELQHYGSKTNLIDFTTDALIALFFACQGLKSKDGRIILMSRSEENVEKYQIRTPQNPRNRVLAQKSRFAQPPHGYIESDDMHVIQVPGKLKHWILIHLYRVHGISSHSIFNDIHGYIHYLESYTNEELVKLHLSADRARTLTGLSPCEEEKGVLESAVRDYDKAISYTPFEETICVEQGQCFVRLQQYDLAVEAFSKAIFLRPDYVTAYIHRAQAFKEKGHIDFAIQDCSTVLELKPWSDDATFCEHMICKLDGSYEHVIKELDNAIETDGDDVGQTHFERGRYQLLLSEWEKAKSDLLIARQSGTEVSTEFCAHYTSISEFNRHYRVRIPDDITAILKP